MIASTSSREALRPRTLILALHLALLPVWLIAVPAASQGNAAPAQRDYALPAANLSDTLNHIAAQAGITLALDPQQVEGRRASPVQGRLYAIDAMTQALRGTGLALERTYLGTYALKRAPSQTGAPARPASTNVMALSTVSVIGQRIDAESVGRSSLNMEQIDTEQAGNVASLVDNLPGVDLAGSPRPGGQAINIWGFNKVQDVKVIVDGAPKGFDKYRQGTVFIEPELIKRIEVNKGPHTTLYGNGGFGGVIAIETKDANDMLRPGENWGGFLKGSYHSNNRENIKTAALYGKTPGSAVDVLAFVTDRNSGDLRKPDGDPFKFSSSDMTTGLLKVNANIATDQRLTVSAMRGRSTGWHPFAAMGEDVAAPTEADIRRYGLDEAWRRKVLYRNQTDDTYAIKWRFSPANNPLVNLTASYAYSKTSQHDVRTASASTGFLGTLGSESWIGYRDQLAELRNESAFSWGPVDHLLTVGGQWHRNDRDTLMNYKAAARDATYNYGYFQPYYMPEGGQRTTSAYAQDAMTVRDVTVTLASRFDRVETEGAPNIASRYNSSLPQAGHDYRGTTYSGWSPRVGLFWKTTPQIALFSDVSRTWRAPLIDEAYTVQGCTAASCSSVPGTSRALDRERVNAVRAGAIFTSNGIVTSDDTAVLRLTAFHHNVTDAINLRRGILYDGYVRGGPNVYPAGLSNYRNLSGYRTHGVELESFYDARRFFASASISLQRGTRRGSQNDPWGPNEYVSTQAADKLIVSVGVKIPEAGMTVGWRGKFVKQQDRVLPKDNFYRLPPTSGYGLHSLFVTWRAATGVLNGLEARLTIDNLFNTHYMPYLSEAVTGVGRDVRLSVSKRF
jgi:hemoglobin/transferrin/lactoferrin receptor protein